MGKFQGVIFILLVSLSTTLFSNDIYINVTNVRSKKQLSYPYQKLRAMGLKMSFKQKRYGYAAYVGPFRSRVRLYDVYDRVKLRFPNARIIVEKTQQQDLSSNKLKKKHEGIVLGLGLGYGSAPSTYIPINGSVDAITPKSSGIDFNIYGGYDFANGVSLLANYMNLNSDDLVFQNYYGSINYRFTPISKLVPYFGLSLGYSSLSWYTSPIENASSSSDNNSGDILYATQVGFNYRLVEILSLKVDYSCLFLNHTTNITKDATNTAKIQHNTMHSVIIALQYTF